MTTLARYITAEVEEIAITLGPVAMGLAGAEHEALLRRLIFRDAESLFWHAEPGTGRWLRHEDGAWHAVTDRPGFCEGPAGLQPSTIRGPLTEPTPAGSPPAKEAAALIEVMTRRARAAYERGDIYSDSAEALANRFLLQDRAGRIFRVGIRSGRWYVFADDSWRDAGGPPPAKDIVSLAQDLPAEVQEQLRAGFVDLLISGAGLAPETVADPWLTDSQPLPCESHLP